MKRRTFLATSALTLAGSAVAAPIERSPRPFNDPHSGTLRPEGSRQATEGPVLPPAGNPIGVSTYSFIGIRPRLTMSACLQLAAEMGFDGVELLQNQMQDQSNATLQNLKREAHSLGMCLMGFSTHQDFVSPDEEERQQNIERTIQQIEMAARLGIPTMRINTGRWERFAHLTT